MLALNLTATEPEPFPFAGRDIRPDADPTKTKGARARWIMDARRRYRDLKRVVRISIVDNDALGLRNLGAFNVALTPLPPKAFARYTDPVKVERFMEWLTIQESRGVLEIVSRPGIVGAEPWTNTYIRSDYAGGLLRGNSDLRQLPLPLGTITPMTPIQAVQAMTLPVNAERTAMLFNSTWEGMKGVTAQMNAQINVVLAEGMAAGTPPTALARQINDRIDSIGLARAETIARTETVLAHNRGAIAEYTRAEADIGEPVRDQWWATLDSRVRPNHAARHGHIFAHKDAEALVGEPNCRCTVLPYVESLSGEVELDSASDFLTPLGKPKPATIKS